MRSLSAVVLVTLLGHTLVAQERKPVAPAEYDSVAGFGEVKVSPAADRIAYTLLTWDSSDDARKGDLWIVGANKDLGAPMRLT